MKRNSCLGRRKSIKQINKKILKMVTFPSDDSRIKTPEEFSRLAVLAREKWFREPKPKYTVTSLAKSQQQCRINAINAFEKNIYCEFCGSDGSDDLEDRCRYCK